MIRRTVGVRLRGRRDLRAQHAADDLRPGRKPKERAATIAHNLPGRGSRGHFLTRAEREVVLPAISCSCAEHDDALLPFFSRPRKNAVRVDVAPLVLGGTTPNSLACSVIAGFPRRVAKADETRTLDFQFGHVRGNRKCFSNFCLFIRVTCYTSENYT